ncbi:hypothetical protein QQX98_009257 [Neonectria punicea]|uniref:Uncharacterized protein n=1 Tax=Neonectria punicea TaxID=979145 RepID=A0ABR1GST9_9HYPO
MLNRLSVEQSDTPPLVPLLSVLNGKIIPGFPMSKSQLENLGGEDTDRILTGLGIVGVGAFPIEMRRRIIALKWVQSCSAI